MKDLSGTKRREFLKLVGVTVFLMAVLGGFTQIPLSFGKETYPAGKIVWIVGHPPGGGIDMVARGVATFMTKHLKAISPNPDRVEVIIKNLPGGAEMRAMDAIYHARPDGYTIASGGDILHTRAIFGELGFDLFEITFIARLSSASKVLVTYNKSNIYTWEDILKASKKAPLRIAITGFGASNHVASILFIDTTGLSAKPVIFDGTAGANAALLRGDVSLGINSEDSLRNLIRIKELRPVLTFSEKTEYPGVKNIKEVGFPELIEPIKSQRYLIAPPGVPKEVRKILEDVLKKTMEDKEFLAWREKAGLNYDPVFGVELDQLVKNIQSFYKNKEKILREYLVAGEGPSTK